MQIRKISITRLQQYLIFLEFFSDSPCSIYKNSNMTPRLSGHFPIFGLVYFVLKSLLGMQNNGAVKIYNFVRKASGVMLEVRFIKRGPLSKARMWWFLRNEGYNCWPWFFLSSDRLLCSFPFLPAYLDVDKCSDGSHDCHPNATCSADTAGNFTCTCQPGFTGNGRQCYGMIYLFVN